MTRKEAVAIIAADMVKQNGGAITRAQAVKTLGPWWSDAQLIKTATEIKAGRHREEGV